MSVLTPALPFEAPVPEAALVPTWPRIVATFATDGRCELAVDDAVRAVQAAGPHEVKVAVEALVREQAQILERTVRMDVVTPDSTGQLLVTPDGEVLDGEVDAAPTHTRPAPEPAAQVREHAPVATNMAGQWALPLPSPAPAPPPPPAPAATQVERPPSPPPPLPEATTPPPQTSPVVEVVEVDVGAPTLADLLGGRAASRPAPAQHGWRAALRAMSGGTISPRPGRVELAQRAAAATIARPLDGPKTVVVVNPKGGAHKTTAALLLAANLGLHRGGSTLAWDNNETRGTMGWRAAQAPHTRTVIDLLGDLERLEGAGVRVGDLDAYVRAQSWGHFDVLASDEDANSADLVDGAAFERLHAALSRFYRVMVVDTGNNMRAPNWAAALAAADQLVIVSTIREDTSQSAAWLADALAATGHRDLVAGAVTVLTAPARTTDPALGTRLHDHFARLTRTVLSVPHDPALIPGGPIDYAALTPASRDAWQRVTAAVTDGL